MWWLPLAAAVVIGAIIILLQVIQTSRELDHTRIYRARFQQLVSHLDQVTVNVNQLAVLVPQVQELRVLDYYESCLRILQTLLETVRKLAPFGQDPTSLNSAFFLARDCKTRVDRTRKAFMEALKGKSVDYASLYGQPKHAIETGCYFCSRPVVTSRFTRVKVRLDNAVKEVLSCNICKQELEETKKIKVLFFVKDGKQIHWSEMSDYKPSEDYWNLNKREPLRRMTRLELIRGSGASDQPNPNA